MGSNAWAVGFSAVLLGWGGAGVVLAWRRAPDSGRAELLEHTAALVLVGGMGAAALAGFAFRAGPPVGFTTLGVAAVLLVASKVVRWRDRRADARQRATFGLAARRRLWPPVAIVVVWAVIAFVATMVFVPLLVLAVVMTTRVEDAPTPTQEVVLLVCLAVWLTGVWWCGWRLVVRQRRRIAAEADRITQLDNEATAAADDAPDPSDNDGEAAT